MKPLLGTVVVENIGGAGASLGAAAVARARPDGYTILLGGTLPHVNETLLKSRPLYDPVKDLDPIVVVANNFLGIAVNPTVPAQTLGELISYAKANPGKLSYGHTGIGSSNHLTGELFKLLAGTPEIVQIPYRGMGPALVDLIGGQVQMAVAGFTGQVLEFGLPDLTVTLSLGLLAPAGTPTTVIERIAEATRTALAEPDYQHALIEGGFEPVLDSNPEKFRQSLSADVALWAPVVKSLGLKLE
jgi:tripartite-type tricarboxylate transporter receptor subunit TctC